MAYDNVVNEIGYNSSISSYQSYYFDPFSIIVSKSGFQKQPRERRLIGAIRSKAQVSNGQRVDKLLNSTARA